MNKLLPVLNFLGLPSLVCQKGIDYLLADAFSVSRGYPDLDKVCDELFVPNAPKRVIHNW